MKSKIVFILFSLVCLNGLAQTGSGKDDHLEPDNGYFDMYSHRYEYYANIRSILFKGLSENPRVRYMAFPSFSTEYVWQIERDPQSRKNTIVVKWAKESIWETKDKSTITVETWRNSLSQEDADLIAQLYLNALLKTRYVVRNSIGLDGCTYYFTVNESGKMSGQTWSPQSGSNTGKLVNISQAILNEAMSKTFVGLSAPLRTQIKELTAALFL